MARILPSAPGFCTGGGKSNPLSIRLWPSLHATSYNGGTTGPYNLLPESMADSRNDWRCFLKMAERIRRARRKAGFSQSALADRVGVQRSAVSNWESASVVLPSLQNLVALAKACGVSFEWLGTGRGRMALEVGLDQIPAADAELVEVRGERDLLALYRDLPQTKRLLVVEVLRVVLGARARPRA